MAWGPGMQLALTGPKVWEVYDNSKSDSKSDSDSDDDYGVDIWDDKDGVDIWDDDVRLRF